MNLLEFKIILYMSITREVNFYYTNFSKMQSYLYFEYTYGSKEVSAYVHTLNTHLIHVKNTVYL